MSTARIVNFPNEMFNDSLYFLEKAKAEKNSQTPPLRIQPFAQIFLPNDLIFKKCHGDNFGDSAYRFWFHN